MDISALYQVSYFLDFIFRSVPVSEFYRLWKKHNLFTCEKLLRQSPPVHKSPFAADMTASGLLRLLFRRRYDIVYYRNRTANEPDCPYYFQRYEFILKMKLRSGQCLNQVRVNNGQKQSRYALSYPTTYLFVVTNATGLCTYYPIGIEEYAYKHTMLQG